MLSDIAEKIFKLKYAVNPNETLEQAAIRVSSTVAEAEREYGNEDKIPKIAGDFYSIIRSKAFVPGGRVIANSGTNIKNLMNCFVLGIDDSRQSIYEALGMSAEVFAWGGGVGYDFSNIRERGSTIKTTGGRASGPLSFMTLFDHTGEVIQQASRRGAQMGVMDISHPDIEEFIDYKSTLSEKNKRIVSEFIGNSGIPPDSKELESLKNVITDNQLTHFNVSISIPDEFMQRVIDGGNWDLVSVYSGEVVKTVNARDMLYKIAERAWASGDPGVLFSDRVNRDNLVLKTHGKITATNPCGEVPLLPYESCCLGSINLHSFYDEKSGMIDFAYLEHVVRTATRFLDDVISISIAPIDKINDTSRSLRRLGIGVMGFADLLAELELPYDSDGAVELANYLSWFISFFAILESIVLANERGSFDAYDKDNMNMDVINRILRSKHVKELYGEDFYSDFKLRNVSVTSIAPTGSIALLAGVNSGIEPFFALAYKRYITEGIGNSIKDTITELNPILRKKLEKYNVQNIDDIISEVERKGSIQDIESIPQELKDVFKTAHDISWVDHVDMQAAWQEYVTNSISKTINCPTETTVGEIFEIYLYMWMCGLKGGTIYRDGSKFFQILNK